MDSDHEEGIACDGYTPHRHFDGPTPSIQWDNKEAKILAATLARTHSNGPDRTDVADPTTTVVMHSDRLDLDAGPIDWRMVGIGGGITAPVDVDEHVYHHLLSAIGTWAFCYAFGLVLGAIASIALRSVLG